MHNHFDKAQLRAARTLELNEGDQLAPEDFPEPVVFAVLTGVIAVESHLSDGRRSLLTLRLPGEYLDMNRADRHASGEVVALAPTSVKLLPRTVFEELLLLDANLRRIYWRRATDIMHQQFDHSSDLGKKTPTERMASFIFELRNRLNIPRFVEEFALPISRQSIADYLGLRAETVSRVFKGLEKEGLIKLVSKHQLAIIDFKGLRKIANGSRPRLSNHR
ncbi:Crp/Fnr family transcriptional regulator [Pseudovibrio axinellae]|nr:helix-turn-helix domain-containing protein [Pseudovibrio axinellae]